MSPLKISVFVTKQSFPRLKNNIKKKQQKNSWENIMRYTFTIDDLYILGGCPQV